MNKKLMALRVAARFSANQRKEVKELVQPVNKPKGISPSLSKEHGSAMSEGHDDMTTPARNDVRPQDVFMPKPNQVGVYNLAETGKDLSNAIENQIPKDKGYDAVRNLSQYLIETGGGGGAKPVR